LKKQPSNDQKKTAAKPSGQRKAEHIPPTAKPAAPTSPSPKLAFRELFRIDPRSLALFRIAVAALLLIDLAIRAFDLNVMYTDDGMFSRAEICRRATTIWNWSFHFGGGSPGYQALLFGIAAALALALLLGFETRLAVIGSWLMLVSIHHRVPPFSVARKTFSGCFLFQRVRMKRRLFGVFGK